jgi:oligosaccharide repeat unit polymerase
VESDSFMVWSGLLLIAFGATNWLLYLRRPDALLFDAVSLAWLGYIVWIGMAVLGNGLLDPARKYADAKYGVVALLAVGSVAYAIGLRIRAGAVFFAKLIPAPRDTLALPIAWAIFIVCAGTFIITATMFEPGSEAQAKIARGIYTGSLGATGILGVLLLVAFRRAWLSKLFGLAGITTALLVMWYTMFSRRPVPALIGALIALVYHLHIRRRALATRLTFLGVCAFSMVVVILVLTATRAQRFREEGRPSLLGQQTLRSLFGGVIINVNAMELTYQTYPERREYLHGSGIAPMVLFWIPRAAWPEKPISTSTVISRQYLGVDTKANLANTIFGELYQNFGLAGVVLGMLVIGMIVAGLNKKLHDNLHNLTLWVVWFMIVPDFMTEWRGDLTAMTVQALLRVALFLGLAWVLAKIVPKRSAEAERYLPIVGGYTASQAPTLQRPGGR